MDRKEGGEGGRGLRLMSRKSSSEPSDGHQASAKSTRGV